jgi:Ni/Fe-hydrogenase subunit HybB-like protein
MLEVALCVMTYTCILVLEFAPAIVEKAVWWTGRTGSNLHGLTKRVEKILNKVVFVFIALGMTLPTMHQSSLGTMLVPFGNFVHPLWQTPILPALYLLTAISMGYGIVMFEATLVSDRFHRPSEARVLGLLSRYMMLVIALFIGVRWGGIIYENKLHYVLTSGGLSFAFLAETALYLVPLVLLSSKARRMSAQYQFISATCMLLGGVMFRMDSYLIAYDRVGWHYFPTVPELLISFGMVAIEVLGYVLIVKFFPVLHSVERAPKAALTVH